MRSLSPHAPADTAPNEGGESRVVIRPSKLAVTASLDAQGFASRLEEMMERRGICQVIDAPPKALGSRQAARGAKWR